MVQFPEEGQHSNRQEQPFEVGEEQHPSRLVGPWEQVVLQAEERHHIPQGLLSAVGVLPNSVVVASQEAQSCFEEEALPSLLEPVAGYSQRQEEGLPILRAAAVDLSAEELRNRSQARREEADHTRQEDLQLQEEEPHSPQSEGARRTLPEAVPHILGSGAVSAEAVDLVKDTMDNLVSSCVLDSILD